MFRWVSSGHGSGLGLVLLLAGVGCEGEINLNAVPAAIVGCEAPTAAQLQEGSRMLPGRDCLACHRAGGQASGEAFGAAGTVYAKTGVGAACNSNGAAGVTVEILDSNATKVLASAVTNDVGNFEFNPNQLAGATQIRARVRRGAMERTMVSPVPPSLGCASCHNPSGSAGDRIFLQ